MQKLTSPVWSAEAKTCRYLRSARTRNTAACNRKVHIESGHHGCAPLARWRDTSGLGM